MSKVPDSVSRNDVPQNGYFSRIMGNDNSTTKMIERLAPKLLFLLCARLTRSLHHRGVGKQLVRLYSATSDKTLVNDFTHPAHRLDHATSAFFVGSCFSENIHNRLQDLKFSSFSNPQGIIFNPVSVAQCLHDIEQEKQVEDKDILLDNQSQVFSSWDFHSSFSSMRKEEVIERAVLQRRAARDHIQKSRFAFITLGTAKVHGLKSQANRVVANCHKQPGSLFSSRILSFLEVSQALRACVQTLRRLQPNIHIVFTVSPVRHTRDTLTVNARSKAVLLSAVHELIAQDSGASQCDYFPSYEYMIDELRDYRWYSDDLIHPSTPAVSYIFSRFLEKYCTADTIQLVERIDRLRRDLAHRSRFPESPAHRQHLESCLRQMDELDRRMAFVYKDCDISTSLWASERQLIKAELEK